MAGQVSVERGASRPGEREMRPGAGSGELVGQEEGSGEWSARREL